ncbi:MAG TPA: hypothetical protein PKD17_05190, partial [Cellvibrionaceae bacterium]|nr:hypothetical protein [Cellvibrionaceae bacterium]
RAQRAQQARKAQPAHKVCRVKQGRRVIRAQRAQQARKAQPAHKVCKVTPVWVCLSVAIPTKFYVRPAPPITIQNGQTLTQV